MLWNGVLPRVQSVDMRQQVSTCDDYKRDVTLALIDYDKKYPDQLNNFLALPTKEESDRINELQANLDTASQELATKLTLGQIPLSDLEKEVEKLDELGLSERHGWMCYCRRHFGGDVFAACEARTWKYVTIKLAAAVHPAHRPWP